VQRIRINAAPKTVVLSLSKHASKFTLSGEAPFDRLRAAVYSGRGRGFDGH
jgi:hypothetical protein